MNSQFTDEQTQTLLKLVHTKAIQKKFDSNKKKHRKVWEEIADILKQQGIVKSASKCQNRYENTKRAYNAIKRGHIGPEKPNYAYWDFWETILGEKNEKRNLVQPFRETRIRLKQEAVHDGSPIPGYEQSTQYELKEAGVGTGTTHELRMICF